MYPESSHHSSSQCGLSEALCSNRSCSSGPLLAANWSIFFETVLNSASDQAMGFNDSLRRTTVSSSVGTGSLGRSRWAANVKVDGNGSGAAAFQWRGRCLRDLTVICRYELRDVARMSSCDLRASICPGKCVPACFECFQEQVGT